MKGSLCRLAETSFLWRDTAMRIRERFNPHAPFEARRRSLLQRSSCWANFNPRAPCGARLRSPLLHAASAYFNPRAPCGARHDPCNAAQWCRKISTHAPLAGRDNGEHKKHNDDNISTHAPLAGRDGCRRCGVTMRLPFQPTRPLRGATPHGGARGAGALRFQPTRPLRGATCYVEAMEDG